MAMRTPPTFPEPDSIGPVDLPLFRFGLRQLLAFVALLSTLLGAMVAAGGPLALLLLVAALVIGLHVTSTALGTKLRSRADRGQANDQHPRSQAPAEAWPPLNVPPRSPWHSARSTPLGWLPKLIIAGIALGGMGGAIFLMLLVGHRLSAAGLAVGSMSLAVLGGWFAFLAGSFCGIMRHGWREAVSEQMKDERKRQNSIMG
jgi:hypothetical protein